MHLLESPQNGFDYRAIGEVYGYNPVPDGCRRASKKNVCIGWNDVRDDLFRAQNEAMNNFNRLDLKL